MNYPPDDNKQSQFIPPPPQPNTYYPPQQQPYRTGGLPPTPHPYYQPYPQQPMYPPQSMRHPPKKNSLLWLWVVLSVVVVLLLGFIGVIMAANSAAKSVKTATVSSGSTAVATTSSGNTPSTTGIVAKIGQTITLQNTAATLISVKKLPDDQYSPASPGNMYIAVHVKLVNNSNGEVDYNVFDFHLKSGSGNITDETYTSSYTDNNQLSSGKLSAGGSVEGDIVFQTGKSDHKAQLTWQPNFFGNAGDNGWLLGL